MEWRKRASALLFHIRQTTDITMMTTTTTVMIDMMSVITTVAVTRSEGESGEMMRVEESVVMVPLKKKTHTR